MTNQQDIIRKKRLLTQVEVCEIADCSTGRLQYHTRRGLIAAPDASLGSRLFYSQVAARQVANYFAARQPWGRITSRKEGE
jgi:hypothetical protein